MFISSVGKVSLPSTILNFFDLGGQRGIRSIWHRYYDDCHAVVYVIDAQDRERLGEGWEVFGTSNRFSKRNVHLLTAAISIFDTILPHTHDSHNRQCPLFTSNPQRPAPPSREQTRYTHEHVRDRNSTGLRSVGSPSTGQRSEAVRRRRRRGRGKEEEADCEPGGVGRVGIRRVRSLRSFIPHCWLNVCVV